MKPYGTYNLGGFSVTLQRYPTRRSVVPSQNQRELRVAQELSDYCVWVMTEYARQKAANLADFRPAFFGAEKVDALVFVK